MSTKLSESHDPRARRTRQSIRQALLDLAKEKGFEQVTVHEIAERAGVNRVTFYKHYENKWDLLTSWVLETRQLLDAQAFSLYDPRARSNSSDFVPEIAVTIFEHIQQNLQFYRLMIGHNAITLIATQLEEQVEDFCREQLLSLVYSEDEPSIPLSLLCREYASSFVGVVRWWIEQDCAYSPQQMAKWAWRGSDELK